MALAGVYLDAEARKLTWDDEFDNELTNHDSFIEFNDRDGTTLKDVLKVMRRAKKALLALEAS